MEAVRGWVWIFSGIAHFHKEMNEYMERTKVYTAFVFMGNSFWKENIEERVKLLESKVFNCCLKITMADLCKIGVKMRE